jgi:hypothetical protein
MENVSMTDPSPILLTPTAEPPRGAPMQTPPWDSIPDSEKQPYRHFWQVILEPPDPVTGEVKAFWDGPPPPLPEEVFNLEGSLRLDVLPDSRPTNAAATDLPPECRNVEIDLRANSPRRPVDWRWQMACRLAIKGLSLRFQDWHLYWAVRFRWALLQWNDELFGHNSRAKAAAALDAAYDFYHAGSNFARWELEARLLANEPPESIAQRFDLSPEAVQWYEALFFNVRECLRATGYITHEVIRLHDQWHGLPNDFERLWKVVGFWRGPQALDELIGGFAAPSPTADKGDFHKQLNDHFRTVVDCKALVAIEMLPLDDPKTAMQFLKVWARLQEIDSRCHRRGRADTNVNVTLNMQCFLDHMRKNCEGTYSPVADHSDPALAEVVRPPSVIPTSDVQGPSPGETAADDDL